MVHPSSGDDGHRLILRPSRKEDYDDIAEIMDRVYKGLDGAWTREQFESQITRFPEGQICIEDNGQVGSLEVGKQADFIVVDADPFEVGASNLAGIEVLRPVVGGTIVYHR